jgi:hypothetical protein
MIKKNKLSRTDKANLKLREYLRDLNAPVNMAGSVQMFRKSIESRESKDNSIEQGG